MKTTVTPTRMFARLPLLLCALALTLAGCSQKSSAPDPQAETPSGDVTKALVHGPVESAFLEPLKDSLELTTHDGSQELEDFDMLIFDGHHHAPAELRDDALVQEALRTGKWVLALDVTAEHKREGLGDMLLSASDGTSPAYAAHVGQDANGRPFIQVIEDTSVEPVGASETTALAASRASLSSLQEIDPYAASAFTDLLLERIAEPAQLQSQAESDDLKDVSYQTIVYTVPVTWTITGSNRAYQLGNVAGLPQQHPNFKAQYTFKVFLSEDEMPNQIVLVEADISASPKRDTEDFVAAQVYTSGNHTYDWDEWGWFQSYFRVDINPAPPANANFQLNKFDSQPVTSNDDRTVTTGIDFEIGVDGEGPNASVSYRSETERKITDWKFDNLGSENNTKWYYRTQYPVDDTIQPPPNANGAYCDQEIYRSCYIKMDPNDLSINSLSLNTQGAWRTGKPDAQGSITGTLVDGGVNFEIAVEHGMLDLFCSDIEIWYCNYPNYNRAFKAVYTTYHINLGAVIPIPVESLTFSPNPAKGGEQEQVTGTVTLSKKATIDTTVKLSSDLNNASVDDTVTVKQGQTSATFLINTNANNIAPGGSLVANIKASTKGGEAQAQLTVTN